ncbi:MAG: hypothetical protein M3P44_04585 [Actinomycetota bacterium]|nr:hypothetical protein [Actinomycetota bacterium]
MRLFASSRLLGSGIIPKTSSWWNRRWGAMTREHDAGPDERQAGFDNFAGNAARVLPTAVLSLCSLEESDT